MAVYVMSDIHGNYEKYASAMEDIDLQNDDELYVLGDVVDRGDGSCKILLDMMCRINVIPLLGNHEFMAINVLSKLFQEITKDSLVGFDMDFMEGMMEWNQNGGYKTIEEFGKLSKENCEAIIEYLEEFQLYAEVRVNNKNYVLVHGGLDNFDESKSLDDYSLDEIIWAETDYDKVYFKDKYLVTGHTPVQVTMSDKSYNKIYKKNNHIAIDCGCIYGGKLGVICLDTMEEMYF